MRAGIEHVAGNMFEEVPKGGVIMLKVSFIFLSVEPAWSTFSFKLRGVLNIYDQFNIFELGEFSVKLNFVRNLNLYA